MRAALAWLTTRLRGILPAALRAQAQLIVWSAVRASRFGRVATDDGAQQGFGNRFIGHSADTLHASDRPDLFTVSRGWLLAPVFSR